MSKEGFNRAERGETGTEDIQKDGKTWSNTLTGGMVGDAGKGEDGERKDGEKK